MRRFLLLASIVTAIIAWGAVRPAEAGRRDCRSGYYSTGYYVVPSYTYRYSTGYRYPSYGSAWINRRYYSGYRSRSLGFGLDLGAGHYGIRRSYYGRHSLGGRHYGGGGHFGHYGGAHFGGHSGFYGRH